MRDGSYYFRIPCAHRSDIASLVGSCFWNAFLYHRICRKSDDVLESYMDVGSSRGLYFGYTGLWHVLGNCLYIFAKENFRICLNGMGGNYNHRAFLLSLASPFFCHGSRPGCELFFWHCDHADCHPLRCPSI